MARGQGRGGGRGPGRMGGTKAAGPGGHCVCPNCGHKIKHRAGQPCYDVKCRKCGTEMTRAKPNLDSNGLTKRESVLRKCA